MGARAGPLAAYEVAVGRRGAALARRHLVRVHREAHRAAGLAPFEARFGEYPVEAFQLGHALDEAGAGDDEGLLDRRADLAAADNLGRLAQVLDPAVGA